MLPFTAAMGRGIPDPVGQEEIISGICNHLRFGRRPEPHVLPHGLSKI
jgi:hypothetical protein